MMVTALQLKCDGNGCDALYPPTGAADGAIFSPNDLRTMARRAGWKCDRSARLDCCFSCARGVPAATKKGGAK